GDEHNTVRRRVWRRVTRSALFPGTTSATDGDTIMRRAFMRKPFRPYGIAVVAVGAVLAIAGRPAALRAQKQALVFVENSHGGDVSIIDAATLKVTGTIPIGQSPDEIVAAPAGDILYLSRIVRRDDGRPTGNGELVAIDPAARAVLWRA